MLFVTDGCFSHQVDIPKAPPVGLFLDEVKRHVKCLYFSALDTILTKVPPFTEDIDTEQTDKSSELFSLLCHLNAILNIQLNPDNSNFKGREGSSYRG